MGKVIGVDGKVYSTVSAAEAAGTTASAMIAYVGSSNGTDGRSAYISAFNHGLAVALTDVSNTSGAEGSANMIWANAGRAASAYTRARPGGTSDWFLPSAYQWERMFIGCGGTTSYTTSFTDGMSFSNGDFRTKMTSCGGTDVQSWEYWSTTEFSSLGAWRYRFTLGAFYWDNYSHKGYARAVLAF